MLRIMFPINSHRFYLTLGIIALCGMSTAPAHAQNALTNSDFNAGINPWSTYTTPFGTSGSGYPTTTSFDVVGNGSASQAATFQAGPTGTVFNNPDSDYQGGGISQDFLLSQDGIGHYHADFAFRSVTVGGELSQYFKLFLDDTLIDSKLFQLTGGLGDIFRSSFDGDTFASAGNHTLKFQVEYDLADPFRSGLIEYADNISLTHPGAPAPASVAVTPEASGMANLAGALLAPGLCGMVVLRRRRHARLSWSRKTQA